MNLKKAKSIRRVVRRLAKKQAKVTGKVAPYRAYIQVRSQIINDPDSVRGAIRAVKRAYP